MFCSEPITLDIKTLCYRRKAVSNVETLEFQATALNRVRWLTWIAKVIVIDMAASIIVNDIRMTVYDCEQYEPL